MSQTRIRPPAPAPKLYSVDAYLILVSRLKRAHHHTTTRQHQSFFILTHLQAKVQYSPFLHSQSQILRGTHATHTHIHPPTGTPTHPHPRLPHLTFPSRIKPPHTNHKTPPQTHDREHRYSSSPTHTHTHTQYTTHKSLLITIRLQSTQASHSVP